jgi:GTPase-associated protein 1, N-terminal domain type 1
MKSIAIQQTLHGYSEGHRLLDGSVKLADELARLVLRMSDLSGGNVVSGFEEYLTGYPIEPINLYAFAKTWYAPEMPRPGCVWTHTLFISGSAMAEIADLQSLTSLFVRPQSPKSITGYSNPIQFEVKQSVVALSPMNGTPVQVADLIETLYAQKKENVLIAAQSSRSYEAALFRVWSQQWPQLRKAFTFCTGALSSRGFAGKPFDVQCAPPVLVREITSATTAKQSTELNLLVKSDQQQAAWFVRATDDALNANGGEFRHLLWEFADVPDRTLYICFAQLIDKFLNASERTVDDLIAMVAEMFPGSDTGFGLKSAFFGRGREIPGFKPFEEGIILSALASTPHFEAFDSEALLLRSRGSDLCNRNVESARQTITRLFRSSVNRLGEDILAGMIEAMNPVIAVAVTTEQPQFLPMLFRAKPELGVSPELWSAAGDRKRELFEALISNPNLNEGLTRSIGLALLESDSEFLLKRALETWGQPVVFGVLDWLAKGNGQLTDRSLGALTYHVESIAQWILAHEDAPQSVVIDAAHIVAPFSYQFRQYDSRVWLRTFRDLAAQGNQSEANYFAAMILALGFQNAPPESLTLVEDCFERVHQLAWNDALPDAAWLILDPIVPHLWWLHDWDKCERLRRGLIEAFVKFRWPAIKLVDCIKNEVFLARVVESAQKVEGGKELLLQKF